MALRIDLETLMRNRLVPKEVMDTILCHLVKRKWWAAQKGLTLPRYHFKVVSFTRHSREQTRIILIAPRGAALSRLKSQYAKKPKNPV